MRHTGLLKPDEGANEMPELHVSYKPQMVSAKWEGSVQELLNAKIREAMMHPQFQTDVVRSRCRKSQGRERADVQHRYSTSQVRDRVHR